MSKHVYRSVLILSQLRSGTMNGECATFAHLPPQFQTHCKCHNGLAADKCIHSGNLYRTCLYAWGYHVYWECTETMGIVSLHKQSNHLIPQNKWSSTCLHSSHFVHILMWRLPHCLGIHFKIHSFPTITISNKGEGQHFLRAPLASQQSAMFMHICTPNTLSCSLITWELVRRCMAPGCDTSTLQHVYTYMISTGCIPTYLPLYIRLYAWLHLYRKAEITIQRTAVIYCMIMRLQIVCRLYRAKVGMLLWTYSLM